MRLWTLHPSYLDGRGLIAAWREALLAQKVLGGGTRGYRSHPQLTRFRAAGDPLASIAAYLQGLADEGTRRGYNFDITRISAAPDFSRLNASLGQVRFEWDHLMSKLEQRAPSLVVTPMPAEIRVHPLFLLVDGPVADWEVAARKGSG